MGYLVNYASVHLNLGNIYLPLLPQNMHDDFLQQMPQSQAYPIT